VDPARIARELVKDLNGLRFGPPVTHVYNPLEYACGPHEAYLKRYGSGRRAVVLLGMNPGPWGMVQTGIPFGEILVVREWLGIHEAVGRPKVEHPHRPVMGFACTRREVSGARLWGWARETFGTPARFFGRFFVANYCPLAFFESDGRNRTPDKLPADERGPLLAACDRALQRTVEHFAAETVIGVGAFAALRAQAALADLGVAVVRIPHPSPANPGANRDWAGGVTRNLASLGLLTPLV